MEGPPGAGLWTLAELFALTGLAIAQPVLDVTGRSPDLFLFRRADRLDILALVVGVTVLPALGIWIVEVLVGLVSATVRRQLHLVAVTGLFTLLDAKGRIDRRVYPNFAALADASTWYRNATGVAGYTPWALPAMLTGNYPAEARAPSYTEYPDNLFTLLSGDYDVRAYETVSEVPALVSGRLASPPPADATVLVAVNGKIAGGSRLFPDRPGEPAAKFAVITPDFLWRAGDGRRQLQLYVVGGSGARPRLHPVNLSAG